MGETIENWMPLTQAATRAGITQPMLSRWVDEKRVQWRKNPRDRRVTLVWWPDIQRILNEEPQPEI
jgi:hypothetical protein